MKKLISLVSLFCLSVFLPLSVMGEPIDREADPHHRRKHHGGDKKLNNGRAH